VTADKDVELPACRQVGRAVMAGQHGRARTAGAGRQLGPQVEAGFFIACSCACRRRRKRRRGGCHLPCGRGRQAYPHAHTLHLQGVILGEITILLLIFRAEVAAQALVVGGRKCQLDRSFLPPETHKNKRPARAEIFGTKTLRQQEIAGFAPKLPEDVGQLPLAVRQQQQQLPLGHALNRGMPNAVGTQQAGIGRDEHPLHAQHGGNIAGVQAAGTAKGKQGIARWLVAAGNGNAAYGFRHFFIGYLLKTFEQRQLVCPYTCLLLKLLLQPVQRLRGCRRRQGDTHEPRVELAQQQIDVGKG